MAAASRPRIALVTARDPSHPHSWSGTDGHIAAALARSVGDVTPLGPIRPRMLERLRRYDDWSRRVTGIGYSAHHSLLLARRYAHCFAERLSRGAFDVIFAPAAATELAFLRTSLPIVYLSDATFAAMIGYYPEFSALSRLSRWEGNQVEARAIARADAVIYASDWAARSARDNYGAPAAKLHVIPFGANLAHAPARAEALAPRRDDGRCRLLFIGRDWQRKGGDIAVDALRRLRQMGIDAELTVCGARRPPTAAPHVHCVPYLEKSDAARAASLAALYRAATLFFLPTRAECAGIVFSEAAAFGLPIVSTDTGGVATAVQDGVTGRLLPLSAGAADYARVIADLLADPLTLARMRTACRDAYEARLNWTAWGAAAGAVVDAVLRRRAAH